MIIDTDYTSLSVVDENIRHYYSKDVRERVIGYTEPNEEGESSPIVESYTVIVLNQPDKVTYQDVEQRRSERKPWDVVRTELQRAIEWEEFYYSHDLYLQWVVDYSQWQGKPGEVNELEPEPAKPEIDLSVRRAFYQTEEARDDERYFIVANHYDETYDDEALMVLRTYHSSPRSQEEVAAFHEELAKCYRDQLIESNIEVHGVMWQVDVTRDEPRIRRAIATATSESIDAETTVDWILADNTVRATTRRDLEQVLAVKSMREQLIFQKYREWRAGDKLETFSLPNNAAKNLAPI
ncbi:TPA: hypothetical protein I7180_17685 [Vibrio vulnificus]|nr:hypothetical protein [Vibrio vulnificus]HAT8548499.1 hypothetical protein [Vibrio vulnificus]